MRELIIKNTKNISFSTQKEFLESYILEGSPATYFKDTGKFQCRGGANRSAEDLNRIVNGMLVDNYTLKETIIDLLDLINISFNTKNRNSACLFYYSIGALYCPNIKKVVFYKALYRGPLSLKHHNSSKGSGNYSWDEMVDIYNNFSNE